MAFRAPRRASLGKNLACFEQKAGTDFAKGRRVGRCRRAGTITYLPERAISKICALVFLALILVPFTAPFKTFEVAGSHHDGAHEGLPKDKIGSDEKAVDPSTSSLILPPLSIVIVTSAIRSHQIEQPLFRSMILRL
jgi:hypothetical protein